MRNNEYIYKTKIKYHEVDRDQFIFLHNLLDYFQHTSSKQSDSLGLTLDYYKEKNFGWVLAKFFIHIDEYPKFEDEIEILTYAESFKKYYATRIFILKKNGKEIARGEGLYMLMDFTARKPLKIPLEIINIYGSINDEFSKERNFKLKPCDFYENKLTRKISYFNIDTNGHVNNKYYALFAMETLSYNFLKKFKPVELKITFDKEISPDENIIIETNTIYNKTFHRLTSNSNELKSLIEINWI